MIRVSVGLEEAYLSVELRGARGHRGGEEAAGGLVQLGPREFH